MPIQRMTCTKGHEWWSGGHTSWDSWGMAWAKSIQVTHCTTDPQQCSPNSLVRLLRPNCSMPKKWNVDLGLLRFWFEEIYPFSSCMQVQLAAGTNISSARLDGSWGPRQFLASLETEWLKVEILKQCSNMLKKVSTTPSTRTGTRAMGN